MINPSTILLKDFRVDLIVDKPVGKVGEDFLSGIPFT